MDVSNNLFNTWEKYRLSDMLRWPGVRNGTCNKNNYKCEYERYLVEFPNSIVDKFSASIFRTAMSVVGSVPSTFAIKVLLSFRRTSTSLAFSTT